MGDGEHNNLVTKAPYDPRAIIFLVQSLWTDFKENLERSGPGLSGEKLNALSSRYGAERTTNRNPTEASQFRSCPHIPSNGEMNVERRPFLFVLLLMQNEHCAFRKENGIDKKNSSLVCFLIIWLDYSAESVTKLDNFRLKKL